MTETHITLKVIKILMSEMKSPWKITYKWVKILSKSYIKRKKATDADSRRVFTRDSPKIAIFNWFFEKLKKLKMNFLKLREVARDRFFFITSQDFEEYDAKEINILLCYTFFAGQKENWNWFWNSIQFLFIWFFNCISNPSRSDFCHFSLIA